MTINELITELSALSPEERQRTACVYSLDKIVPITQPVVGEREVVELEGQFSDLLDWFPELTPQKVMVIS